MGENYTIASMGLSSRGVAFFVLPEEGATPQDLLEDPDFWEGLGQFLNGGAYTKVNWSVPKFTVDSQYQLEAMLPQLGFDTACDPEAADFSGISEVERLTLSQTSHGVHFAIDEEGIEAAAYTATGMSGSSGPPPKEIDMVLDRPFLYGGDGLYLHPGGEKTAKWTAPCCSWERAATPLPPERSQRVPGPWPDGP